MVKLLTEFRDCTDAVKRKIHECRTILESLRPGEGKVDILDSGNREECMKQGSNT